MNKVILDARDIVKNYKNKSVLKGVSIQLREGEIHSLLGPNGAGKTTFIKILATLLSMNSGSVSLYGKDSVRCREEVRHLIGYVGQDTERSAYARLTVVENLYFFGRLRGLSKKIIESRIAVLSQYFDFSNHLNSLFVHLSGGQKQTVVIMRGLLHDPPVIFLDEPTKGLDPLIARKIRGFIRSYVTNEKKGLLLTSHIMNEVDELSDKVSFIRDGRISVSGKPAVLKTAAGPDNFIEFNEGSLPRKIEKEILRLPSISGKVNRTQGIISYIAKDFFQSMHQIMTLLQNNGINVSFNHHKTTLEDAFFYYSKSEERLKAKTVME